GPAVASTPKVITVRAISAMSAISGMTASRRLGDRGPGGAASSVPSVGRGSATSEARPQVGGHRPRRFMPGVARLAPVEGDEADDGGGDHQRQDRTTKPHGSDPVSLDRAGHAVATTAALAELEALDLDALHAGLAHARDRVGVALVGDDHAGLDGDDVVAVVPLLPLLLVCSSPGLDDLDSARVQGVCDGGEEVG